MNQYKDTAGGQVNRQDSMLFVTLHKFPKDKVLHIWKGISSYYKADLSRITKAVRVLAGCQIVHQPHFLLPGLAQLVYCATTEPFWCVDGQVISHTIT